MPSKRMVSMGQGMSCRACPGIQTRATSSRRTGLRVQPAMTGWFLLALARILDVLDDVELHVPQLAVLLLHLAQVDVLDDVAGLGVDEHGAARALEDLALHAVHQRFAAALAAGLLQRVID